MLVTVYPKEGTMALDVLLLDIDSDLGYYQPEWSDMSTLEQEEAIDVYLKDNYGILDFEWE